MHANKRYCTVFPSEASPGYSFCRVRRSPGLLPGTRCFRAAFYCRRFLPGASAKSEAGFDGQIQIYNLSETLYCCPG